MKKGASLPASSVQEALDIVASQPHRPSVRIVGPMHRHQQLRLRTRACSMDATVASTMPSRRTAPAGMGGGK
jgi:hypothetical protein